MRLSLLIVGNFLSAALGTRGICEELAPRLSHAGWIVATTSHRHERMMRLLDMVNTTWLRRGLYDVAQVDVYSGPAFLWAEAVSATLQSVRKPYVLTLHGGNLPVFAKRWPWRVRRLLGGAAAVTTPSRYLLEQMQPYRADLRLLPNPLELAHYPFLLRVQPQPRLVWLRAFHQIYNPVLAVHVVAQLVREWPDLQLTMVGPDKGDGSLEAVRAAIQAYGLAAHVTLQGGVAKADVPAWLCRGDIFLNTTNFDNTPVSVLEAMACGICVVSTNVGGIPYLLDYEQNALLVPPDDPEAMATAVRRILGEPGLAARLSANARAKAEQYDWSVVLPQWEALLAETISQS